MNFLSAEILDRAANVPYGASVIVILLSLKMYGESWADEGLIALSFVFLFIGMMMSDKANAKKNQ